MSIATKLTYLNTTKGKIKDSINLTGAGITNEDTFRSYAVKLRDGLVQVLNDNGETLYNNFPKSSGSGSSITLNDTLEAPMRNKMFKGNTLQDGTPTPSTPIEIQSVEGIQNITISDGTDSDSYEVNLEGKNLCSEAFFVDKNTFRMNIIPKTIKQTFTLSLIPTATISQMYIIAFADNTNLGRIAYIDFVDGETCSQTITLTDNVYNTIKNSTEAHFNLYKSGANMDTTSTVREPQIEKGSQATSYVPYRLPIKMYDDDYITGTPDNWSIVRNNEKIILDGSENWTYYQNNIFYTFIYNYPEILKSSAINCISDSYKCLISTSSASDFGNLSANYDYTMNLHTITELIRIKDTRFTTSQQLKTALTNNNVEVVYKLDTPTTTSITDTYLISQLNALYNAKSYNGQTNISVSGNLPMILDVSALKDEI